MKEDFTDEDGIKAAELEGEFAELDGWAAESNAEMLLNGLGVTNEFHYAKMKELTGGQKVKVLLAHALFGNPDILLLDEPTASLDADNEAMVQRALDEISKERTIIMIAHRLKTVRGAQQILVLENGRVTQKGTHNQLVGTDGLYSRLWELQNQAGNYTFKQS